LARAALELEARAERLGIPRERRAFRPHLTLGRVKEHARLPALEGAIRRESGYRGPTFPVRELVLFQSERGPEGARYRAHQRIPLY
jgi:2'-5' RNA ligase